MAGTDHVFSFYGVLTPQADTQWVRVFPVEMRLEPAHAPSIDAVVTSTDQQTGARQTWRDTVLTVFDGGPDAVNGYFFWAPLTPGYGNAYRIDVERSDGVAAHATAFVPTRSELEVQPPVSTQTASARVLIRGTASHFISVGLRYDVKFGFGEGTEISLQRAYEQRIDPVDGGYLVVIDLGRAQNEIESLLRANLIFDASFGVELLGLTLHLLVTDPAWDPPGDVLTFDPNVLVEPNQMRNVTGGFGFVGAGYRLEQTWLPDEQTLRNAGFQIHQDTTAAAF